MERNRLFDLQEIHGILQSHAALPIIIKDTEHLLKVIVKQRLRQRITDPVIIHIPLKLIQIQTSPGNKPAILPAPAEEIPDHRRKCTGMRQLILRHRNDFLRAKV